jgi:hypothetical protein
MESKIYYFEEAKAENTDILLALVKKKALKKVLSTSSLPQLEVIQESKQEKLSRILE